MLCCRFVELVKSKTGKVTIYSDRAKCVLMENSPPNFEANFYNGLLCAFIFFSGGFHIDSVIYLWPLHWACLMISSVCHLLNLMKVLFKAAVLEQVLWSHVHECRTAPLSCKSDDLMCTGWWWVHSIVSSKSKCFIYDNLCKGPKITMMDRKVHIQEDNGVALIFSQDSISNMVNVYTLDLIHHAIQVRHSAKPCRHG